MMKEKSMKSQMSAFQLKGSLLTLTVLELLKTDMPAISAQFLSLVKQTPELFQRMPIIIDLHKISPHEEADSLDFESLKLLLLELGLVPVGIRGLNTMHQQIKANEAGFAILNNSRGETIQKTTHTKNENIAKIEKTPPHFLSAKMITQPVRSGQQIYAKDTDLIILASVSPGAEILACGNIHVYGTLAGRALAGVNGNKEARIFCKKLKAELISIAGHYLVNEDLSSMPSTEYDQILQIYLSKDHLQIEVI